MKTQTMIHNGKPYEVEVNDIETAKREGLELAVKMRAPNGTEQWISYSLASAYLAADFKIIPN